MPAQIGGAFNPNEDVSLGGSLTVAGGISNTGTVASGYGTGAGGTVTQQTSKSTAVTLNKLCGTITMNGAALNAGVEVAFTVNNSLVAATDIPVVCIKSGATAASYLVCVDAVAAGSFSVCLSNASAGNLSEAVVLSFAIIKGVAA